MKVIKEGHRYEAYNQEDKNAFQIIQFIEKEPDGSGGFRTVTDGTTNEELLSILIDRLQKMQEKVPCRENAISLTNLEQALMWLEKRTKDRQKRGVEGTPNK